MAKGFISSIKGRLSLASLVLLPLICGLFAWSLDRAFSASLKEGIKNQLILQAYALIAEAELEDDTLRFPERFSEDRLNQTSSDLFALVYSESDPVPVWRSASGVNKTLPEQFRVQPFASGKKHFGEANLANTPYFSFQYDLVWEGESGQAYPFHIVLLEQQGSYAKQRENYRSTLWIWLTIIATTLIVIQVMILRWGLKPIDVLVGELNAIKQGNKTSLSGEYPNELQPMTNSLNILLEHESSQRERYRNTLSDLAHSIKTPLAIIQANTQSGNLSLEEVSAQSERINQIVSYQLNKATSGKTIPFGKAVAIKPLCTKIISAMEKVYSDKSSDVVLNLPDSLCFKADEGDLMELLGNLIDNAFKYGQQTVHISAMQDRTTLTLWIEDDGPGIPVKQHRQLLKRGARADTSLPGQGIGLAVVSDIVECYAGVISLGTGKLGGLQVKMVFQL